MANIKNMQMWDTICADARISVSKSMFGLCTRATYKPTGSRIDAKSLEYSYADGERLKRLLTTPQENMLDAIGDYRPETADNGNYMAEVCFSRDANYLAVQLFQFARTSYEPATDVLIFEDGDAHAVRQLF